MMRGMADLRIAADLENLAEIRRFVRETAAALGADPETVSSLELAVEEAACNAIVHGYRGRAGSLEVGIERDGEALLIRLRDWAPPFDPTLVPDPDLTVPLAKRPLGGMGVYLIRHSVDEIDYRALPEGGNELALRKRLGKEEGDEHSHL